jgi:hypothetical protein
VTTTTRKKQAPVCSRCPGAGATWRELNGKRTWFCPFHLKEAERELREVAYAKFAKTETQEVAAPACPVSNTAVDHPPHYNVGKFEVIDVIDDWSLSFNLGNVVKYVARAQHKGNELEDLEKAAWYLAREIARRKA